MKCEGERIRCWVAEGSALHEGANATDALLGQADIATNRELHVPVCEERVKLIGVKLKRNETEMLRIVKASSLL